MVLFGLTALATEGGSWYYTQRNSRTASDMAAMAGANILYWDALADPSLTAPTASARSRAIAAGAETAGGNGFRAGEQATSVAINIPPASGPNQGNGFAVEAIVRRNVQTFVSALFLGADSVEVATRAVAASYDAGPVCIQTLHGSMTFTGNTSATSPTCVFASNNRGNQSISVQGSASVRASLLRASGTCAGCDNTGRVLPPTGATSGEAPLPDPFERQVSQAPMPASCPSGAQTVKSITDAIRNWSKSNATPFPMPNLGGTTYFCGTGNGSNRDFKLTSGQVVDLSPGTYYFYNADITLNAQTGLICSQCNPGGPGVTLVLAGDPAGTININGSARLDLNAPNSGYFGDLLIYRQASASDTACNPNSNNCPPNNLINGTSSTRMVGGIYMPTGMLTFSGNSNNAMLCTRIVTHTMSFTGNSDMTRDCAQAGVPVQRLRVVRLVE